MSSKPQTVQQSRRIVPAIPHQLVRRAKVSLVDGKKEAPTQEPIKATTSPTRNGNTGELQNGVEERVTNQVHETKFEASEEKEVLTDKKDSNGELSETPNNINRIHKPDAQARPFVTQHQARQSDALVFGGLQDSSNASPAAPSSMYMAPPPSVPAQMTRPIPPQENWYPGSAPGPHFAPAPWVGPSPVNGHGFAAVNGMSYPQNGLSRSPSQTSSKALGDSTAGTPDAQAPFKRHVPTSSFHMPPFDANVQHLLDFLLAQFGKVEFADHVLDLSSATKSMTLPVHSLILARCPQMIHALHSMPSRRDNYSGIVHVHVSQFYYFQDQDAFVDATRFLYGAPLIDPTPLLQGLPRFSPVSGEHRSNMVYRMRYILSYLTAGYTLNISDIIMHGANIASQLVGWETLETLLSFATAGVSDDGSGAPSYGPHASHMLSQVVNFLVLNMTPDFVLDTSVSQLPGLSRLPQSSSTQESEQFSRPESRASIFANPKAAPTQHPSGIRFGQAPPTDSEASTSTKNMSSMLLSLPYFVLKILLENHVLVERLGMETLQVIAGDVVRERERRRREALGAMQDKSAANHVLLGEERLVSDDYGRTIGLSRSRVAL